jgi:hypothetical protein
MPDLAKLKRLAETLRDSLDCFGGHPNGGDWRPGEKGFDEHAYDEYHSDADGGEGCLHCMAVDALASKRRRVP